MGNYFINRDLKNLSTISGYLDKLPDFCYDFFLDKENYTTTNTRVASAIDLSVFFDFICRYKFANTPKDITYKEIAQITAMDISSFLSYLSYYTYNGKNYKNNTISKARKLASIRGLFKWLFKRNYINNDVASKVDTPKRNDKDIIHLEVDEIVKILNTTEDGNQNMTKHQKSYQKNTAIRDTAILTLFLSTGIRVSECVGLNIDDFDFQNNAFKITRKGGNQAVLYLSEEARNAILKWLEVRKNSKIPEEETAMFTSLQKKRITVRAVEYLVKKYAKMVNPLKRITPHKLRSTFGTNLYRTTKDIYIVADVLGHRDINITKKHYAAMGEDTRKQVAQIVKLRDN